MASSGSRLARGKITTDRQWLTWGCFYNSSTGGMAVSPGPPRPGRSAALDLAEWWIGGWADRASLCSQLVDPGCLDRNFLRVKESVARAPDH
jgi:hypothetical protein